MMNRDRTRREELNRITEQIIGGAFTVSNELGSGFLEKVYENALAHELRKAGIRVEQQYPIKVHYDGIVVGDYVADLLVEGCVLVELKAIKATLKWPNASTTSRRQICASAYCSTLVGQELRSNELSTIFSLTMAD